MSAHAAALADAARIADYWRARGYEVNARVERIDGDWLVVSDLVRGLPRGFRARDAMVKALAGPSAADAPIGRGRTKAVKASPAAQTAPVRKGVAGQVEALLRAAPDEWHVLTDLRAETGASPEGLRRGLALLVEEGVIDADWAPPRSKGGSAARVFRLKPSATERAA